MKMDSVTSTIRNQIAYNYISSSANSKSDSKKTNKNNYWKEAIAGSMIGCATVPMVYKFDKTGHIENVPEIKTSKLVTICLLIMAITVAVVALGHKIGQKITENAKNRTGTKTQ